MWPLVHLSLFTLTATLAPSLFAAQKYDRKKVIAYAKSVDVSQLDGTLRSQRLDEWLRSGATRSDPPDWRVSEDCDLKYGPSGPPKDAPLCVRVTFGRALAGGRTAGGWAILTVGTRSQGI